MNAYTPHIKPAEPPLPQACKVVISVTAAASRLNDIEAALGDIDYQLNNLQPPQTGKIRLDKCKVKANDGSVTIRRRPAVYRRVKNFPDIRWTRAWVPNKSLWLRVKKSRDFEENHRVVRHLLKIASQLLDERELILLRFNALMQALVPCERRLKKSLSEASNYTCMIMDELITVDRFGEQRAALSAEKRKREEARKQEITRPDPDPDPDPDGDDVWDNE